MNIEINGNLMIGWFLYDVYRILESSTSDFYQHKRSNNF